MLSQVSKHQAPWQAFKQIRNKLATAWGLGLISLFTAACTSNVPGPGCKVGANGIADAAITGKTLLDKTLVFTFDHSPSAFTTEIADLLTSRQINAAFFVVGKKLEDADDKTILGHIRANGHLIGNGTYSYANLAAVPVPSGELRQVDQMITPNVVGNMFFFRPGAKSFSHKVATFLNEQGLQKYVGPIGSDIALADGTDPIDANCWDTGTSTADCAQHYLDAINLAKQGIVRFTDGSSQTTALLQALIPLLTSAGYKFARLDDVPEIRSAFLEREATPGTVGGPAGCKDYDRS